MSSSSDRLLDVINGAKSAILSRLDDTSHDENAVTVAAVDDIPEEKFCSQLDNVLDTQPAHQRLIFTDPVAFRYLEEDPSTTVLERRRELSGYEVYIVEQWACSRVDPTFVITTFTGLPQHTVLVGVLSVPTNEHEWSDRLRVYLKAINKFHARKKETPLGILMVTNLSSFPSALTVIAVPGGDVKAHRENFIINEDLKRLGCSGRAGMNLASPVGATQAKFCQLYRTSDRVAFSSAVIELVKLCQISLVMFTRLAPEYADGLLCDVTERAINDWWVEIGPEYFSVEPSDGILGPTTVAALLGMFLGARNRLNAYGSPVAKDVFDLKATKRGIAYFQKSQRIPKTRRLDRQTLKALHRSTSKAANSEGWTVPKAVKSTVAELGGKGGEMVMGMVGARDRAGIADVETLDIGTFILMISGERCKWLWHGKPPKTNHGDLLGGFAAEDEMVFSGDEAGGYMWASRKRNSGTDQGLATTTHLDQPYQHVSYGSQNSLDPPERDQAFRKIVLKSVTDKMSDARLGLGRFKDAVGIAGLRGHHHRLSKDDLTSPSGEDRRRLNMRDGHMNIEIDTPPPSPKEIQSRLTGGDEFTENRVPQSVRDAAVLARASGLMDFPLYPASVPSPDTGGVQSPKSRKGAFSSRSQSESYEIFKSDRITKKLSKEIISAPRAIVKSARALSYSDNLSMSRIVHQSDQSATQSTQSLSLPPRAISSPNAGAQWPRHLSFSVMDEVLGNVVDDTLEPDPRESYKSMSFHLANEALLAHDTRRMTTQLERMHVQDTTWITRSVQMIEDLNQSACKDQNDLDMICCQKLEEQDCLRGATADVVSEERLSLTVALKDIDVLGAKLEYELSALKSKIDDVEDSVTDFDRQVLDLEIRAMDLEVKEQDRDTWQSWIVKLLWRKSHAALTYLYDTRNI
ncbi:hypothetical protein MMC32_008390 [Xylographa parallela]|nr:hypothetical protein [Xylographa parallela]